MSYHFVGDDVDLAAQQEQMTWCKQHVLTENGDLPRDDAHAEVLCNAKLAADFSRGNSVLSSILNVFSTAGQQAGSAVATTASGVGKWTTGKALATVGIAGLVGYLVL